MPWGPRDASSKTHRADTPKKKRQWSHIANAVLKSTGDEGRAIREANGVAKKKNWIQAARGK